MEQLNVGIVGTCALALEDCAAPDPKVVKSVLKAMVLRIGDVEAEPDEGIEIQVKISKATAAVRPTSMKKFVMREGNAWNGSAGQVSQTQGGVSVPASALGAISMKTEYVIERKDPDAEDNVEEEDEEDEDTVYEVVEKDSLVKAFKYGATWVPVEDDSIETLNTVKSIEIVSFIAISAVRCLVLRITHS